MATQRLRVRYSTTLVLASALISGLTVTLSSHGVRVRSPRGGEHVDGSDTGRGILHAAEFPTGARSRIRLDRFAALDGTLGRSRIPSGALRLCLRGGDGESRFLGRDRALEEINAAVEKGVQRGVDMQYVDKTGQVGVKGEEEHTMFQELLAQTERDTYQHPMEKPANVSGKAPWWDTVTQEGNAEDEDLEDEKKAREGWQEKLDGGVSVENCPVMHRFDGRKVRNRALYLSDTETDKEMIERQYNGHNLGNATRRGLYELKTAAECNDAQEIERLVLEDKIPVGGHADPMGEEQAIHFACWCGSVKAVEMLLDLGADPNCQNYYRQTPIHRAAATGHQTICELLVSRGAEPLAKDSFNFTAPLYASVNNYNYTTQWFYAKFIEKGFPRGPPPHFGFDENEGYAYFQPYEVKNHTGGVFMNYVKEDPDSKQAATWEGLIKMYKDKVLLHKMLENSYDQGKTRENEIKQERAERRQETDVKRQGLARTALRISEREAYEGANTAGHEALE